MFGGWGSWIAEQATAVTQIAAETMNEIIAESKETFSSNNNNNSKAESSQKTQLVPLLLWNVNKPFFSSNDNVVEGTDPASPSMFVDENMTSFPSASSKTKSSSNNNNNNEICCFPESKFWSSNPMQWKALIKDGLSRDVNTFVISPEVLIFESSTSSSSSSENNNNNNNNHNETNIKIILEKILSSNNDKGNTEIQIVTNDENNNNNHLGHHQVVFPESFSSLSGDSIRAMLKEDPILADLRYDLVPKWVKENDFWRNFGFRVYLLSKTESIDQAIEILKIVNEEHRNIIINNKHEDGGEDQEKNPNNKNNASATKNNNNDKMQTYAAILDVIDSTLPVAASQQFLIQGESHRFHSNRNLKKKGFGVKRNQHHLQRLTENTDDDEQQQAQSSSLISFEELKENIQATGETESWQKHFSSRASKELENVRSVVLMLEKLISEVEAVIASLVSQQQQQSSSSSSTTVVMTGAELPSIELIQSIAESCQFHKGRVAALIGELQSAPSERVEGHGDLDPDAGSISLALRSSTAKMGEVLMKQVTTMKNLSAAVRNEQNRVSSAADDENHNHQEEKIAAAVVVVATATTTTTVTQQRDHHREVEDVDKKENDADLFEDDNSSFDYVSSPVTEQPPASNNISHKQQQQQAKTGNNTSEFVAQLPWDDDDE